MEHKNVGNSDKITREYFDSLLVEMRHIDNQKPIFHINLHIVNCFLPYR